MTTDSRNVRRIRTSVGGVSAVERPGAQAERLRRIHELAYVKAERRGFAPGFEWQDWLDAERDVDSGSRPAVLPLESDPCIGPRVRGRAAGIEQRQGRRVPIRVPVRLNLCDGRMYRGFVTDVCRDGMFVRTAASLSKSRCLQVRIDASSVVDKLFVDIPVFVVHQANGGYGLMFRALDEASAAVVQSLRTPRPSAATVVPSLNVRKSSA